MDLSESQFTTLGKKNVRNIPKDGQLSAMKDWKDCSPKLTSLFWLNSKSKEHNWKFSILVAPTILIEWTEES